MNLQTRLVHEGFATYVAVKIDSNLGGFHLHRGISIVIILVGHLEHFLVVILNFSLTFSNLLLQIGN